jgi:hypothetical protein
LLAGLKFPREFSYFIFLGEVEVDERLYGLHPIIVVEHATVTVCTAAHTWEEALVELASRITAV